MHRWWAILVLLGACGGSSGTVANPDAGVDGGAVACTFSGSMGEATCSSGDCVAGYCLTPSGPTTCRPSDRGPDGCDATSICRPTASGQFTCFAAPACPMNGVCPAPLSGQVGIAEAQNAVACNTGADAAKARICIPGRCLSNQDCAEQGNECVLALPGDVLGYCYGTAVQLESDGNGAAWESAPGCEVTPSLLRGKAAPGSDCTQPTECAPTCCSCSGSADQGVLAAKCTLTSATQGTCASPADACSAAFDGAIKGATCSAP